MIIKLAKQINQHTETVKHLPPQTKGRLLYELSLYFRHVAQGVIVQPDPAKAMVRLIRQVQSAAEWRVILQNIVPADPKHAHSSVLPEAGQSRLLANMTFRRTDVERALAEKEQQFEAQASSSLLGNQIAYEVCLNQLKQRDNEQKNNLLQAGLVHVLTVLHFASCNLRDIALKRQAINRLKLKEAGFHHLYQQAKQKFAADKQARQQLNTFEALADLTPVT